MKKLIMCEGVFVYTLYTLGDALMFKIGLIREERMHEASTVDYS